VDSAYLAVKNSVIYLLANSPLVSQIVYANGSATRMTTGKTYDHLNCLTAISSSPSGSGLLAIGYHGASATTNAFVAYDGNGNVTALINALDGTLLANYDYGPFGEVIRATGPARGTNPFRFSTKYQDDESDLLYYGRRYYKPSTGTWLSRDPVGENRQHNLYGFVHNAPLLGVDLFGLQETFPPPSPPENWTEATATAELEDELAWFDGEGYYFAALLLQNFLNGGGDLTITDPAIINEIKSSSKCRTAMQSHLQSDADNYCRNNGRWFSGSSGSINATGIFEVYYMPGLSDLGYALGGAHFTYNGPMTVTCPCKFFVTIAKWNWSGTAVQKDDYVFLNSSPGNVWPVYSAAVYLQNTYPNKYHGFWDTESWADSFSSSKLP